MKIISKSLIISSLFALSACTNKDCEYPSPETYPFSCDGGMDIAFVIDYTGSMGSAIDGIKTSVSSIVGTIVTESAGDYRLSLSIFDEEQKAPPISAYITGSDYTSLPTSQKIVKTTGPTTNQYLTMMEKFATANSATFTSQLSKLNASMPMGWGIGGPEPGGMLMSEIINNNFAGNWRVGKTKFLIIITDAQDGGDDDNANATDDTYLSNLANQANANQIQVILISKLPSSNYELKLINAYPTNNYKVISTNFDNIATDINNIIKNICDKNQ